MPQHKVCAPNRSQPCCASSSMSSTEELTIRDLRPRDVRPLLEISEEAFSIERQMFGGNPPGLARQIRLMALLYPLQRRLPRPTAIALIGLVGGAPVGAVVVDPMKPSWYVNTMMVARDHRQRGYARALMEALQARATRSGARWLLLHVRDNNAPAHKLYESLGFHEFERRHEMLLANPGPVNSSPLPEGYVLVPRKRYDRRALAVRDASREPEAARLEPPSRHPGIVMRALGAFSPPADSDYQCIICGGGWVGLWDYVQSSATASVRLTVQLVPEHRGQGLERPLLERAIVRAGQSGADRLTISVGSTNRTLLAACDEVGFNTRFVRIGMARRLGQDG